MFHQRFTAYPWNPYLGNVLILFGTHVIVVTLHPFGSLPAYAKLIYFASTVMRSRVRDEGDQGPAATPRPVLLAFISLAVITDCYVAALYILRSEALALGCTVLVSVVIAAARWSFGRSLRDARKTTAAEPCISCRIMVAISIR